MYVPWHRHRLLAKIAELSDKDFLTVDEFFHNEMYQNDDCSDGSEDSRGNPKKKKKKDSEVDEELASAIQNILQHRYYVERGEPWQTAFSMLEPLDRSISDVINTANKAKDNEGKAMFITRQDYYTGNWEIALPSYKRRAASPAM